MKYDYNLEFGRRLNVACDDNPNVPSLGAGRQTWLRDRLKDRGIDVKLQSVNRWFTGIARPHYKNLVAISEILNISAGWLTDGKLDVKPKSQQRKLVIAEEGSVSLLTGMLQAKGYAVAFPDDDDTVAKEEGVSLFSIIRGTKHAFHAALCKDEGSGTLSVCFPSSSVRKNTLVAVFIDDDFIADAYEVNGEWVYENFSKNKGMYEVTFNIENLPDGVRTFSKFMSVITS